SLTPSREHGLDWAAAGEPPASEVGRPTSAKSEIGPEVGRRPAIKGFAARVVRNRDKWFIITMIQIGMRVAFQPLNHVRVWRFL
ncbi:MAG: hypothetical protein U1E18_23685, partial [Brevundimonas sp.]|uniref:hypothetical protein n=1 Tax=Brevundimonas sp. TaxID=1871086 RepID=UPI002ABC2272